MVLVGVGTFFAQAIATGFVGRAATSDRGSASGLYLASYFFGGLIGSAVLGVIFDMFGWTACVGGIAVSLLVAALLAVFLKTPMTPTRLTLLDAFPGAPRWAAVLLDPAQSPARGSSLCSAPRWKRPSGCLPASPGGLDRSSEYQSSRPPVLPWSRGAPRIYAYRRIRVPQEAARTERPGLRRASSCTPTFPMTATEFQIGPRINHFLSGAE